MDKHRKGFVWIGIFFLFLQGFIIYLAYSISNYEIFFWFCDNSPLLFAIAFFLKDVDMIKALINIGFIGQFVWIIDFFYKFLTGNYLFGVTSYVFNYGFDWVALIPISAHFFSTVLAFYMTFRYKPKFISIIYSFIYLIIIYILTVFFTNPINNINCIYEICGFENIVVLPFYTYIWPLFALLFIILPTYYLQIIVYRKWNK